MCEYLWACAVTTWIQSWENDYASCGDTCDVAYRSKLEICFQGQVGGSLSWDVKCQDTCVLVKPSQAPEMPECELWAARVCTASKTSSSCSPESKARSLEHPIPLNKQFKEDRRLNHCAVSASSNKLQAVRGAPACVLPVREVSKLFSNNCWCLTESRESSLIPTAIHNFGDSILEPWVVRLEEQIPWCIFLLIEKSTLNVIHRTFIKPLQYEKVILLHWCEKGCTH